MKRGAALLLVGALLLVVAYRRRRPPRPWNEDWSDSAMDAYNEYDGVNWTWTTPSWVSSAAGSSR